MTREAKIFTKGGDQGETSLLGGTRVPKFHERIEAYGTLDELNSFIGLLRDQPIDNFTREILLRIQQNLFIAESHLAADKDQDVKRLPQISEEEIVFLEDEIDRMSRGLPELRSFILPGGHQVVSLCHIVRTVCRRAERLTVKLRETSPVDEIIIKYLNRLSDYFFVLGRKIAKDFNIGEVLWEPYK
jgi:cob(I)alamin adenosyltransferase